MAKLRLINPSSPNPVRRDSRPVQVDVAVDAPAIHLQGEYTYLASERTVRIGSLVSVPFSRGETYGFVTQVKAADSNEYRWIKNVLVADPLFDEQSLLRYRRIATEYGSSLISILKLGIPLRRPSKPDRALREEAKPRHPSSSDASYLTKLFGHSWSGEDRVNLLLPPAVLWEHVAISLFLADPRKTIIMVPTEQDLKILMIALQQRGISDYITITSTQKTSERTRQFLELISTKPRLVIGTRAVTFAPFNPETTVIVDPSHDGYQERRSPYSRSDDPAIWEGRVVTINHSRQLATLARGERYLATKGESRTTVLPTSLENTVDDLRREINRVRPGAMVLISINDSSFASGLRCAYCRNSSRCDCGFPLRIPSRGAAATCSKCLRAYPDYRCGHCGRSELTATRGGSRNWALTLAKSVKGSRVILSESTNFKSHIVRNPHETTIVIAQHLFEPRVLDDNGKADGFDIVVLIGGRSGFNSDTLTKNDRFRMRWARIRGLVISSDSIFLLDIDPEHPEFAEFRSPLSGRGLEMLLQEREQLHLPPFSVLAEIKGSNASLHQLRRTLEGDALFMREGNMIFPVHEESLIVKVATKDRNELLRLLQAVVRLRSSKRLAPIQYILSPLHL